MKYWKIGSRWHDNGAKSNSILDVFLQNSIVFVKEKNSLNDTPETGHTENTCSSKVHRTCTSSLGFNPS